MRRISLIPLLLIGSALSAAAQDELTARNEAFLRAVASGRRDSVAAFFPRHGDWTWIQGTLNAPTHVPDAIRRFGASETVRAISRGGPLCDSFWQGTGGSGPLETVLSMQIRANGTRWRRVAGDRFVPPGASARSPVFVQWTREDGRWVVSSFGDATYWFPPAPLGAAAPDTSPPLPPTPVYATGERWFLNHEPITFNGTRYLSYGLPRPLADSLLTRVGRKGPVAIYAEKGHAGPPEILYLPTAPGEFQPYQAAEGYVECQ